MRRQHLCVAGLLAALTAFSVATNARAELQLFYPFIDAANPDPNQISNLGATTTPGTFMGGGISNYVDGAPGSFSSTAIGLAQGGLQFNGVGDHADPNATRILTGVMTSTLGLNSDNYTATGWIKLDNLTGDSMIFGQPTGLPDGQVLHNGVRDPRAHFGHWGLDTAGSQVLNANQWYHMSYVFRDGATQQIFVNGVLDAASNQDNLRHDSELLVGTSGNGGTVAGVLDDVMVFDQALAQNQIEYLAAGGDPTALPGPTIFNQYTGKTTYIQGPNGKWNRVEYWASTATYEQAQALAGEKTFNGLTGRLALPRNQLDAERLASLNVANGSNAWIGLDDVAVEGEWRASTGEQIWSGAAAGTPVGGAFNHWNPGEPNDVGGEDAAESIIGNGRWNDVPHAAATVTRDFIVEYDTQLDSRPALPGPNGGVGTFGVHLRYNAGNFHSPLGAEAAAYSGLGTPFEEQVSSINFNDPQGANNGLFANDSPFPGESGGDDQNFTMMARGRIRIPEGQGGNYTFGFRGDDGSLLRVVGQNFASSTSCGDPNARTGGGHHQDTLGFLAPTGNGCMLGVVNLAPGDYDLEFQWNEIGGGASAELFAAQGAHTAVNQQFNIIGAPAVPASLTKPNIRSGAGNANTGWDVIVVTNPDTLPGGHVLDDAIANVNNHWNGAPGSSTLLGSATTPAVNLTDDVEGGGGMGFPQQVFPGLANGAPDNDFAIGARGTIEVVTPGSYTFTVLADDSHRLQILGTTGWTVAPGDANRIALADGFEFRSCCSEQSATVMLEAGTYPIQLFWQEGGGGAYVGLAASVNGGARFLLGEMGSDGRPAGLQLVPEPSTYLMALLAVAGTVLVRRRRRVG